MRTDLDLESGRVFEPLPFAKVHARDFRLPPDSPALEAGCYPRSEVPARSWELLPHEPPGP